MVRKRAGKKVSGEKPGKGGQLEMLFEEAWKAGKNLQFTPSPSNEDKYLQTITELAGAVAHELFQPLTAMIINAELLLQQMGSDDPGRPFVEVIMKDINRLTELIGNIDRISAYKTKTYLGETKILDLDKSTPSKKNLS